MMTPIRASVPSRPRGRPRLAPGTTSPIKLSASIPEPDAVNFVEGLHFAFRLGREPTAFITVQWRHAPGTRSVAERMKRLNNKMATWLQAHTGEPAIWAQFREGGKHKGDHLHLLVWVPAACMSAFEAQFALWIAADSNAKPIDTAIVVRPITPGTTLTAKGLRSYGLKQGCDAVRAKWVSDGHQKAPRGRPVMGQRVKVSHSIGRTAREAAGFSLTLGDNVVAFDHRRRPQGSIPDRIAA